MSLTSDLDKYRRMAVKTRYGSEPVRLMVGMDEDGWFKVIPLEDRGSVLNYLRNVNYGDMWHNDLEDNLAEMGIEESEITSLDDEQFETFVHSFGSYRQIQICEI